MYGKKSLLLQKDVTESHLTRDIALWWANASRPQGAVSSNFSR
jgi:hypothetical protein